MVIFGHRLGGSNPPKNPKITFFLGKIFWIRARNACFNELLYKVNDCGFNKVTLCALFRTEISICLQKFDYSICYCPNISVCCLKFVLINSLT